MDIFYYQQYLPLKRNRVVLRNGSSILRTRGRIYLYVVCIIPGQLGDKQYHSYIVPGQIMYKILRETNFYVLPLFDSYVE